MRGFGQVATVFLSYVREDEDRARALASHLESAGHSVWWDRRIKGGAQYSEEIEAALKSADKVVVLWSDGSVRSPWVRDEAAAGRDNGRLIPVMLDSAEPPLGFRQFQSIDFSGWRGRGRPRGLDELLGAIPADERPAVGSAPASVVRKPPRHLKSVALAGLLAIVPAAGGAIFFLYGSSPSVATVLVRPASADQASAAVARDLVTHLGDLDAASVSGFRLTSNKDQGARATFILEVGAKDGGGKASRDVTLLSGKDSSVVWTGHFEQSSDKSADLSSQVGVASALVIKCALEAGAARPRLDQDTVKLYLTGCSRLEDQFDETATHVTPYFEKVVERSPKFAAAWDKLLQSQAWRVFFEAESPVAPKLRRNLQRAQKLGIAAPGIYFAETSLRQSNDFAGRIDSLERGISKYPEDASLHSTLASALMSVGRQNDAVSEALAASELDPLSPATRSNYIYILGHSGRYEQAKQEIDRAERLWPGTTALGQIRFFLDLRYGDPRSALALARQGALRWGQGQVEAFLNARIEPTEANIDRAIAEAAKFNRQQPIYISGPAQALGAFGRTDDAIKVLLGYRTPQFAGYNSETFFRPALREVRRDPQFMQAMAQMGLAQYWQRSGKWPDFCFEPDLPYDCKEETNRYAP